MSRYEPGDFIKVEFPNQTTGISESMWLKVDGCGDEKQLVFAILDNEPLGDYGPNVSLGPELAVGFAWIRDHKKPEEFLPNN